MDKIWKKLAFLTRATRVITPWYVFIGVAGAIFFREAVFQLADYDSHINGGWGYVAALLFMFVAHGYRCQYTHLKDEIDEVEKQLTRIIQEQEASNDQ